MKPQIYVGAPGSGKSRVAGMIAKHIGKKNVCWIDGRNSMDIKKILKVLSLGIKGNEILLIVDNIPSGFDYTALPPLIVFDKEEKDLEFCITASPKRRKEFVAHIPQLILITDAPISEFQSQGMSFKRRFDVVEFPLSDPNSGKKDIEILAPQHPDFFLLKMLIEQHVSLNYGCKHDFRNTIRACADFEKYGNCKVDRENTLKHLRKNGAYCDCEVLMNIE